MRKAARSATVGVLGAVALCLSVAACSSEVKTGAGAPASTISGASAGTVNPMSAGSSPAAATTTPTTTTPTTTKPTTTTAAATAPGSGSGALDVCSLLSAAQASSANSVTYTTAVPQHVQPGYDVCDYHNSGQHSSPIDIQDLTVTVVSVAGCWSQYEEIDGPGTTIAGLGDAAFGYEIGVDVKDADRCLEIKGLTSNEFRGNYGPDTAMAKIIIAGLH